jgi:hypothetical protein
MPSDDVRLSEMTQDRKRDTNRPKHLLGVGDLR